VENQNDANPSKRYAGRDSKKTGSPMEERSEERKSQELPEEGGFCLRNRKKSLTRIEGVSFETDSLKSGREDQSYCSSLFEEEV